MVERQWPDGVTLHVALDANMPDYSVVIRENGRHLHTPHLTLSNDLQRLQALFILWEDRSIDNEVSEIIEISVCVIDIQRREGIAPHKM
jgi:hypothetical protein